MTQKSELSRPARRRGVGVDGLEEMEAFLGALVGPEGMPEDERLIVCAFRADPDEARVGEWKLRAYRPGGAIPAHPRDNAYTTISSFRRAADGSWRRRGECFAAGRALMIDDVGTKVDPNVLNFLPPSALVETSPANRQAWYFLAEPERDRSRFDALIRAFIAQRLLGSDPGMSGVTRVGRIPGTRNTKAKYGGDARVQLLALEPERRFTIAELVSAFGLTLVGRRSTGEGRLLPADQMERAREWAAAFDFLAARGLLKRAEADAGGWIEMRCPWVEGHSGRADSGAAMREPAEDNRWVGAFRCHHGHCADRGWTDLTDWIAEEAEESLNNAAEREMKE